MIYCWAVIDVLVFFCLKGYGDEIWQTPGDMHQHQHTIHKLHTWDTGSSSGKKEETLVGNTTSTYPRSIQHDWTRGRNTCWTGPKPGIELRTMRPVCYQSTQKYEKTHRVILSGWICHWRVVVQEIRNFFQQFNLIWPLFNQVSVENVF